MRKEVLLKLIAATTLSLATVSASDLAFAKRREKAKPFILKGFVAQISVGSIIVGGRTIAITSRTKFEDFLGGATSLQAFHVGDCVKVKLLPSQSAMTAREVELEDNCRAVTPVPGTPTAISTPSATATAGPVVGTATPIATVTAVPTSRSDDHGHHHESEHDEGDDDDRTPTPSRTPSVDVTATPGASATAVATPTGKSDDRGLGQDGGRDGTDRHGSRGKGQSRGRGRGQR